MQEDLKMTYHILWLEGGKHRICGSDSYRINEIRQNYPNLHLAKQTCFLTAKLHLQT